MKLSANLAIQMPCIRNVFKIIQNGNKKMADETVRKLGEENALHMRCG